MTVFIFRKLLIGLLIGLLLLLFGNTITAQPKGYAPNTTPTWQQCIDFYKMLDKKYEEASLIDMGKTDAGKPLHLLILNRQKVFYPELFDQTKVILLINNAIHAGEPDGVNASMEFCDSLLNPNSSLYSLLDKMIVCVIPIYNVDGALNRNSTSRANQNGPAEYGFRANSRNLDLNRDFVKCDSKNSLNFAMMYQRIKPHVVVDTHVSNGADYSYTMTLITTQSDKLGGSPGKFIHDVMEPSLYHSMDTKGFPMSPYVHTMGSTPETGLIGFLETPRYSTGYTALFGSLGFVTETHMLKPFDKRVKATYVFFQSLGNFIFEGNTAIINAVASGRDEILKMNKVPLSFKLDTTRSEKFSFRGYISTLKESKIGNGQRLFYDTTSSWQKDIPYFRNYSESDIVDVPDYYVIPQAWHQVVDRMKANGVLMQPIKTDTLFEVECYYIVDFKTAKDPYEGHYAHSKVKVRKTLKTVAFFKGDWMIPTTQFAKRYLVETLEPVGDDSFFAWNFFDSILQQKEWFSDYVFEEKAEEILRKTPNLKLQFDKVMQEDERIRNSHSEQLSWIYKNSDLVESSAFRYPVFRYSPR